MAFGGSFKKFGGTFSFFSYWEWRTGRLVGAKLERHAMQVDGVDQGMGLHNLLIVVRGDVETRCHHASNCQFFI